MREILFRGKTIDGNWVNGFYLHAQDVGIDAHFIITPKGFDVEVIPSTIGQFTGLYDRDGKRIFEGDVDVTYGRICFDAGRFCFYESGIGLYKVHPNDITIIGNIHES